MTTEFVNNNSTRDFVTHFLLGRWHNDIYDIEFTLERGELMIAIQPALSIEKIGPIECKLKFPQKGECVIVSNDNSQYQIDALFTIAEHGILQEKLYIEINLKKERLTKFKENI